MIVLASAKTMKPSADEDATKPVFAEKSQQIRKQIAKMSIDELQNYFKIKGKTLENTHKYYSQPIYGKVVTSLDGAVFKQIQPLNDEYIANNLYVLDTMYGILNGNDQIELFRLDFTLKSVVEQSYYNFWKEDVNKYIDNHHHHQLLILSSDEYTKLIDKASISKQIFEIEFDPEIKSSVHKKQCRGKIANYCIANHIEDYSNLDNTQIDEYNLTLKGITIYITRAN
ncbi:peroxide stress protein YaaA [Mollicutes bacterium LVI A0039]|nr:peroxide stress protein YaaA [Mollicutes bacterium LVI A0039]